MTRRLLGAALVLVAIGLVVFLLARGGDSRRGDQTEASPSITLAEESSNRTSAPSAATATTPTAATGRAIMADPAGAIDGFVTRFVRALDEDDTGFLIDSLHPKVVEAYGRDLCSAWIEREIVTLEDYQLTGDPVGPTTRRSHTPAGLVEISGTFEVPVSFTFGGRQFDSRAGFAITGGSVYWLGECR